MKNNGFVAFLRRKQYLIAGAIVVVAAVGTTVLYSNVKEDEREQMEAELAEENSQMEPEVVAVEDTEKTAEASVFIQPESTGSTEMVETTEVTETTEMTESTEEAKIAEEQEKEEEGKEPQTAETAAGKNTLHFSPDQGILWPMEGNVILNYSMDATIYFPTLDQYKYNPAVIIEGEVNDKVYAVAKGKVTSIGNNEVTGCTMTVDMGDGYEAIYGQLKELNFAEGDYVEAGHVLGFVAEPTKYFAVEGSNLYFALQKDGEPVDPIEFFE